MNNTFENDLQHLEREIQEFTGLLDTYHFPGSYSERLKELAHALKNRSMLWYGIDFFRVFDPAVFRQRVFQSWLEQKTSSRDWLSWLRNCLFGLMILFSIFVVHNLSRAYRTAVTLEPAIQETTFINIWLNQFSGILPDVLSFAWVSTILLILLSSLLFVVVLHKQREMQLTKNAKLISDDVTEKFENLLVHIQMVTNRQYQHYYAKSEQRSIELLESITQFVDRFENHSTELENIIAGEQKRLTEFARLQMDESEKMKHLTANMQEFSNHFASSVTQYRETLSGFQSVVQFLGQEGKQFTENQKEQLALLSQASSNSNALEKEVNRLIQVQRKISHDLLNATQQNAEKSDELSNAVNGLNSVTRQVVEGQINLQNLLDDQMRANDSWVRSVGQSITSMTEVLNRIQSWLDVNTADIRNNNDQA